MWRHDNHMHEACMTKEYEYCTYLQQTAIVQQWMKSTIAICSECISSYWCSNHAIMWQNHVIRMSCHFLVPNWRRRMGWRLRNISPFICTRIFVTVWSSSGLKEQTCVLIHVASWIRTSYLYWILRNLKETNSLLCNTFICCPVLCCCKMVHSIKLPPWQWHSCRIWMFLSILLCILWHAEVNVTWHLWHQCNCSIHYFSNGFLHSSLPPP